MFNKKGPVFRRTQVEMNRGPSEDGPLMFNKTGPIFWMGPGESF